MNAARRIFAIDLSAAAAAAVVAAWFLFGAGIAPLSAQNQTPADGPAPAVSAALAPLERVHQLLSQADHRPIARYLQASAERRFGPLGLLQSQAAAAMPRVRTLLALLKDGSEAAPARENDSREASQLAAQLTQLEQRLEARLLVEQLGAADWRKREAAETALDHLGRNALPELTWGLCSDDPEIAARCLQLLVAIRGRGYIGIAFVILPPALNAAEAAQKGLPFVGGVEVDQVVDGLPGAAAGLKPGDIIIGLGPLRIFTWSDLLRAVDFFGPDAPTSITFVRDGKIETTQLTLGRRPDGIN